MCRNIKKLRFAERAPTDAELHDAALQFVRKISGFRVPSAANKEAFDAAVADIAHVGRHLFDHLEVRGHTPHTHAGDHGHAHDHVHAHG